MEIAIGQPNLRVGDFAGNAAAILDVAERARSQGARLLLLPGRSLGGDPVGALLEHREFWAQSEAALERIRTRAPRGLCVVLGLQGREGDDRVVALQDGEVVAEGGGEPLVFEVDGVRVGVVFPTREPDTLDRNLSRLRGEGAQLVLLPDCLPFFVGGHRWANDLCSALAKKHGIPLARSQPVGGNGSLVFEGGSSAFSAEGKELVRAERFREAWASLKIETFVVEGEPSVALPRRPSTPLTLMGVDTSDVIEALCLGIRDLVTKSGFEKVLLGLSGGIDSAVVATLAARALGPERVIAVAMPSKYTSTMSMEDAQALSAAQGIELRILPIEPAVQTFAASLREAIGGEPEGLVAENLQARVRGVLLMALSNHEGALVLNSGNKSELAVGYTTLYGDMVGALAVVGDLPKTWVYEVARQLNLQGARIPPRILSRPPSAELRPDQRDQESLPPYESLDRILHRSLDEGWDVSQMLEAHENEGDVLRALGLLLGSGYKRRQAPPPLRVTLGGLHDRAYPFTHAFRLEGRAGGQSSS